MNPISRIMERELQSTRRQEEIDEEGEEEILPNISTLSPTRSFNNPNSNTNDNWRDFTSFTTQDSTNQFNSRNQASSPIPLGHFNIPHPPLTFLQNQQTSSLSWNSLPNSASLDDQFANFPQPPTTPSFDYHPQLQPLQQQQHYNVQHSPLPPSSSGSSASNSSFHPYYSNSPDSPTVINRRRSNSGTSVSSSSNLRTFSLPLGIQSSNSNSNSSATPIPPFISENYQLHSPGARRSTTGSMDDNRFNRNDAELREEKRKRNAESSARHREKIRQRLSDLDGQVFNLEQELENARSGREQNGALREKDEIIDVLRRENHELRMREAQCFTQSGRSTSQDSTRELSPRSTFYHQLYSNSDSPQQIYSPPFPIGFPQSNSSFPLSPESHFQQQQQKQDYHHHQQQQEQSYDQHQQLGIPESYQRFQSQQLQSLSPHQSAYQQIQRQTPLLQPQHKHQDLYQNIPEPESQSQSQSQPDSQHHASSSTNSNQPQPQPHYNHRQLPQLILPYNNQHMPTPVETPRNYSPLEHSQTRHPLPFVVESAEGIRGEGGEMTREKEGDEVITSPQSAVSLSSSIAGSVMSEIDNAGNGNVGDFRVKDHVEL